MYKKIKLLVILRGGYAYSRGYVYCFCQMFQGLRLFKGVRLFRSLEYMNFSVKLQNITDISLVPFNIPGNVHFSFSFTSSTLVRRFPCKLVYFWIAFWNLLLNDGLLPSVSNFVIANGFFFFSKMMRKRKPKITRSMY